MQFKFDMTILKKLFFLFNKFYDTNCAYLIGNKAFNIQQIQATVPKFVLGGFM